MKTYFPPNYKLLEKEALASRVVCLFFIVVIIIDLVNITDTASRINRTFVSTIFLTLFAIQFIFQYKTINLILGGLLFLGCFYMLFALFSEYNDFTIKNKETNTLLTVGLTLFLSGMVFSVLMLRSFIKK